VVAAALTNMSRVPKVSSVTFIMLRHSSIFARFALTKTTLQDGELNSLAKRSPRCSLRPVTTRPRQPRSLNRRSVASPSPCVLPVTTATLPCREDLEEGNCDDIVVLFILFCSVLFCSVLFCSVLFCSVPSDVSLC